MNILSIGNSFSQDAQRYLHQIGRSDGFAIHAVNLYIGGCSLARHYRNMLSGKSAYLLEINGNNSGFTVSLEQALLNREWDVITLQQVSHESMNYDSYQPYLDQLAEYVRRYQPKAKLVIHQTWAYEKDSQRLTQELGYTDPQTMLQEVTQTYDRAAQQIGAELVIPSGQLMGALLRAGIESVHRDTFHASLGLGRYALGLLWYTMLTGRPVQEIAYCDFDREVTPEEMAIAKKCVMEVASQYRC